MPETSAGTGVGSKYTRSKLSTTVWTEKGIVSSIRSWDEGYGESTWRIHVPVKVNDVPVSAVVDASA